MDKLWGTFALVSYIPTPLGPVLDDLRRKVPGNDRTQAHITLLPPRKLQVCVEDASEQATRILGNFGGFNVQLSSVEQFPITNVLYLNLTDGSSNIHALHNELNQDGLADDEQFEFHPHLTLGGPVDEGHLPRIHQSVSEAWEAVKLQKHFFLGEVVALWANPGVNGCSGWKRVWTYQLRARPRERGLRAATGQRL
jgi:2'-5' RNA ligase